MSNAGIKIEVHLLQNFSPSNLNRDDTGQPKSAMFGGYRRARISSQCSKRSTRMMWRQTGAMTVGERTKLLKSKLVPMLRAEGRTDEQIEKAIEAFLKTFYSKMDGDKTSVLLFLSQGEIDTVARLITDYWEPLTTEKKKAGLDTKQKKDIEQQIRTAELSPDIALFGRMLAEQPGRNTDGACQVAHPISTHKVDMEMDFYTAVDDLNPEGETGAGMMGIVGFNSACYYRYAVVDRDQLARNLSKKTERPDGEWAHQLSSNDYTEADKVIRAFLEAMVYAIPTGKQNSFAAQNLPSFGMFVQRQGGVPISLANAFAKPIRPRGDDDDIVGLSVAALGKHWTEMTKVYGDQGLNELACFHIEQESRLNGLKEHVCDNVSTAIETVMNGLE